MQESMRCQPRWDCEIKAKTHSIARCAMLCPQSRVDPSDNAKKYSSFVTKRTGGNRAVAEACLHILKKFFKYSIR